jgi:hypothetical protein
LILRRHCEQNKQRYHFVAVTQFAFVLTLHYSAFVRRALARWCSLPTSTRGSPLDSSQIRTEREMCSDDVAVAGGGDALAYVRALAGLESNRARQVALLLAANGGSLSNRIARVLGQSPTAAFNLPRAGMVVCGAILTVRACGLLAGAADTRSAFEVASLKRDASETGVDRIDFSKGSMIIINVSLKRLIGMAFGVAEGRDYLFSGPEWLDSERFDIRAKFPPETPKPEVLFMLQRLLEEPVRAEASSRRS